MDSRIRILKGDITTLAVDAIVNAAKNSLLGGGGVDGAIHQAAGPGLVAACRQLGGCKTGEAVLTQGFNLQARYVIHTVGPIWQGGASGEAELLAACYRNSLALAHQHQLKTLAFPCISTGIYGFPPELAAPIAIDQVREFLASNSLPEQVSFVCFSTKDQALYEVNMRHINSLEA